MRFFAGLNVWALPLAAFASFVFGGIWYGVLSKTWMAAANMSEEKLKANGGMAIAPLVITFLAPVVARFALKFGPPEFFAVQFLTIFRRALASAPQRLTPASQQQLTLQPVQLRLTEA